MNNIINKISFNTNYMKKTSFQPAFKGIRTPLSKIDLGEQIDPFFIRLKNSIFAQRSAKKIKIEIHKIIDSTETVYKNAKDTIETVKNLIQRGVDGNFATIESSRGKQVFNAVNVAGEKVLTTMQEYNPNGILYRQTSTLHNEPFLIEEFSQQTKKTNLISISGFNSDDSVNFTVQTGKNKKNGNVDEIFEFFYKKLSGYYKDKNLGHYGVNLGQNADGSFNYCKNATSENNQTFIKNLFRFDKNLNLTGYAEGVSKQPGKDTHYDKIVVIPHK